MNKEFSPMNKQVEDNLIIILQDMLEDYKKVIKRLQATIVLLVILMVGGFLYYEWSFKSFLQQYDIENTITTTTTTSTDAKNYGTNGNSTNNINVAIPEEKNKKE